MSSWRRGPWPAWWSWELAVGSHALERMAARHVSEADLRDMFERVTELRPGRNALRWEVRARYASRRWRIELEFDPTERLLVLITLYPDKE